MALSTVEYLIRSGVGRAVAGFARMEVESGGSVKFKRGESPLSRAIRRIQNDYTTARGKPISYEDARNVYRYQLRVAHRVEREAAKAMDRIARGLTPQVPRVQPTVDSTRAYITRVEWTSTTTGRTDWRTVVVYADHDLSFAELNRLASEESRMQWSRSPMLNKRTGRAMDPKNWQPTKVVWIG